MPTGYTADVATGEGTDFRTFALRCARAFGALVGQRDDPPGDLPKHREVAPYYAQWIARDEARIAELDAMTYEQAQQAMTVAISEAEAHRAEYISTRENTRTRYETMLREVEEWSPPTSDHTELKTFMIEQLTNSIAFDCGGTWTPSVPKFASAAAWLADQRHQAEQSLARSKQSLADDIARCTEANAWIDALYASLP